LAHRVQHPGQKPNHALVLGGKDMLLQPVKMAVGPWNFQEISPTNLLESFNPFVKAVVLRMSEAHDLGESERTNRYALYERVKVYAAAPPDVLHCNDKYIRRHYVPKVLGLIVTTNHKTYGLMCSMRSATGKDNRPFAPCCRWRLHRAARHWSGYSIDVTGARSRIGWNAAATSPAAIPIGTMACGGSTVAAKADTMRTR
jgi:hypothetical protein